MKKKIQRENKEVEVVDFATTYSKMVQYEQQRNSPYKGNRKRQGNKNMAAAAAGMGSPGAGLALGSLELRDLRKEVETLGASGLDRKSAKEWKGRNLVRNLGYTKLDKKPRMSAKIGLGIMKKKIQRETKARELARETGMLVRPPKKGKSFTSSKKKGGFSARGKKTLAKKNK